AGHHGTVVARDSFQRSATAGWARADVGGDWSYPDGGTPFAIRDGAGSIRLQAPGSATETVLRGARGHDMTMRLTTSLGAAPTGAGPRVSMRLRRGAAGEYRMTLRFAPDGVYGSITRTGGSGSVVIAAETRLSGVKSAAGRVTWLKARVRGNAPVRVSLK